jgi:hypothetical protein
MKNHGMAALACGLLCGVILAGCPAGDGGAEPVPKSSEAALQSLSVDPGTLDPAFDPGTTAYAVTVDHATASIAVTAAASHPGATVSGTGSRPLSVGANSLAVAVTAEDGVAVKTYDLAVTRRADETPRTVHIAAGGNGSVSAVVSGGLPGTLVALTITAAEDYHLNPLSLKYRNESSGQEVPIDPNSRSFILPASDVTVSAEFIPLEDFYRLLIPVKGAVVAIAPLDGDGGGYPFAEARLPVAVPDFELGAVEVTGELWDEVASWAVDPARGARKYTLGGGVNDDPSQPVTGIAWPHMVVWCNAYSEYARASLGDAFAGFEPLYAFGGVALRSSGYTAEGLTENWVELPAPDPSKKGFRLPAEAEWEFAARGGVPNEDETAPWNWLYAGHRTGYESVAATGARARPGTRLPNTLGLYDMSGNVMEATFDLTAAGRAWRGGHYSLSAGPPKISSRMLGASGSATFGFRVVCQR